VTSPTGANDSSPEQLFQASITHLPQPLPEFVQRRLLDYYASDIAPIMVWLDSERNEYSRLVVPLADKQLVLRLAILAISSAHMQPDPEIQAGFSESASQAAVSIITERVRRMAGSDTEDNRPCTTSDDGALEGVLAAMLILSNYSLVGARMSHAQSHRDAARILVHTLTLNRTPNDELFIFLKNQVAAYDILSCTTLFDFEHVEHAVLPSFERGDIVFGGFLNIVHQITTQSLQEVHLDTRSRSNLIMELEDQFELARGSTLLAAGPLISSYSSSSKQDFTRLIQVYHHAGVLYACQRLCKHETSEAGKHHASRLFTVLERFENINTFLHDLVWPVFIAGIWVDRDRERMRMVTNLCQRLSANTGFKYYNDMSNFLQELWRSLHQDWSLLAREWHRKGVPIIPV